MNREAKYEARRGRREALRGRSRMWGKRKLRTDEDAENTRLGKLSRR